LSRTMLRRSRESIGLRSGSNASVMFLDEIADLKDRYLTRFRVLHVLSREEQEVELLSGRLDSARFERLLEGLLPAKDVDEWFLCGPQALVLELKEVLDRFGAPSVHTELFHADIAPRARIEADAVPGGSEVTVRLDGRSSTFSLAADDVPVLEATLRVRPDAPFACRGGVCGTCRAKVVEGSVVMDTNWALEPDELERGYVLTCQSHPTAAKVVLDYDG